MILYKRESLLSILRWSSLRQCRDRIISVTLEVCPESCLTHLAALRLAASSLEIFESVSRHQTVEQYSNRGRTRTLQAEDLRDSE